MGNVSGKNITALIKYFLYFSVYFHNDLKHATSRVVPKSSVCRQLHMHKYEISFKVKRKYADEELAPNHCRQLKISFLRGVFCKIVN